MGIYQVCWTAERLLTPSGPFIDCKNSSNYMLLLGSVSLFRANRKNSSNYMLLVGSVSIFRAVRKISNNHMFLLCSVSIFSANIWFIFDSEFFLEGG